MSAQHAWPALPDHPGRPTTDRSQPQPPPPPQQQPPRRDNNRFPGHTVSDDIRKQQPQGKQQQKQQQRRRSRGGVPPRDEQLELELFGDPDAVRTGINFDKYDDIPVDITGSNVPQGISSFEELNLPDLLATNISLARYTRPTPVQKYALAACTQGRDLMACAQTGSGKTAAFLIPSLHRAMSGQLKLASRRAKYSSGNQRFRSKATPSILVLAPTRELATQIFQEARKFCYRTALHPVVVYGGQEIRLQLRELQRGCDVLVATPGRLADFVQRRRISLSGVRILIFDEADRMLDMGFEPQIRHIVEEEDMPVSGRQTLMFSATFPKEIQKLAQDFLCDYVFLAVGRVGSTTDSISQRIEYTDERDKRRSLLRILPTCEGLTLIFVETKRAADALEDWLMLEGVNATSIHGDRSQEEREYSLQQFREGRCPVLVATDVASRGLDIPNVLHVINYDMPSQIDDYVHRIGRTGRCGNTGTAISFVNDRCQSIIRPLYDLLKENGQSVPTFLEQMIHSGGFGSRRRAGARGGSRFGAHDARSAQYGDTRRPCPDQYDSFEPSYQQRQQQQNNSNQGQPQRGGRRSRKGKQQAAVAEDWVDAFRSTRNLGGNYSADAW